MNQPILLYRSGSVYANETAAWAALDAVTHKKGQPIVAFYTLSSPVSGHHGSSTIGAIFAIGIGDGVGQYKACTSHDDMLIVAQSLNAHITQFNQMFEYDANHNAIKAKLDFYTTDGKSISAGGIGSGSSASLGALYQLVDVMANSSNTGVEGAVEGSVLAYDATAGKWKAIAQSEILPDMSGYYTKDETDSAINTAKSNLQGQVDTLQALIPATASATNQLADKDFVNSSIATATAEFKGSFTSLDELKATSGNLNDYAFYLHKDSVGNSIVDRYKWTTAGWLYEYTLNNSSFTAEQWAALNSAITATLVNSYNSHLKNSTIHITSDERTKWNNKWDYNEETIKAVKVNAAVLSDSATKLQTPRTLWGRPFDGNADVSGRMSGVDAIVSNTTDGYYVGNRNDGLVDVTTGGLLLYSYNATPMSFYTNRTERMQITADGNILIGTTTNQNSSKLQVNGSINTTTGYRIGALDILTKRTGHLAIGEETTVYASSPTHIYGTDVVLKYSTSRYIGFILNTSGNVLIGTTTDNGYKLQVNGKGYYSDDLIVGGEVVAVAGEGTPAGVTDYSALTGKPAINGVTLVSGNNTLAALGIQAAGDYVTNSGVTTLLADYATKVFVSNNYAGKSAFNSHIADTNIHITSAERDAWNAKWDYNEATIKAVKVTSASSADSVAWSGIKDKPTTFTPSAHTHTASEVSGLPTSLKNPYALSFGSKTYDGSAAATITASDLGALTAHQSIYALTLQVNGTSKGVYNPASAAKTINIAVPTKTSDITNDSGFITSAAIPTALKNPYAVEIKANGVSLGTYDGSATAIFNLSAANVGAASKVHSHNASEISGLPTNLSAFTNDVGYITGITKSMVEGVLTGNITSHTHTFASLTSKPDTLAGYGISDGVSHRYLFFKENHEYYALLLCKVGTSTTRTSHDINGTLYTTVSGANRYHAAYINIHCSDWGDSHNESYNFTPFGMGDALRLVTCTYQSQTWLAVVYTNVQGHYAYFDGVEFGMSLTPVKYYNVSSGEVFNSEIYNSISDVSYNKLPFIASSNTVLDSGNYNSYAPTLTGTGASGTWGINISGNAASATKLQTPRTIWGQSFDGSGNVDGHMLGVDYIVSNTTDGYYVGNRNDGLVDVTTGGLLLYSYNATPMSFYTNRTERMQITADGNILIGTTTNQNSSKLQVNGSINTTTGYRIGALDILTKRTGHLAIGEETTVYASSPTHIYGTDVVLKYSTSRYIGFILNTSGNVTIGSSDLASTTTKLYVNGRGHFAGDLIVDGEVSALVA